MKKLIIYINNQKYQAKEGETILAVCRRNAIEIPTLCHDERLNPYSACYLCVVEVDGNPNLQTACSTKITDKMKVITENEKIKKARKTALDLMLSNHYADCLAPCKLTCPAGVDVQGYIALAEKGLLEEAIDLIKEDNPLPAICGRVCVRPCEVACRRNLVDNIGGGIDYVKRYIADETLEKKVKKAKLKKNAKKIAIIGSGPGGVSAAHFLQTKGYQVDIFEAMPQAGGWLRYGIPEYRLPNDILDKEIKNITDLGVKIFYNQKLGDNLKYEKLKKDYQAVILAVGSQIGTKIGCPGEEAKNVFSGIEFLKNMEATGQRPDLKGKTVSVIGGGNTAMDCSRTAVRLGAKKVYLIYRRSEAEMPANPIEIHESKVEGVSYKTLRNPIKINQNSKGEVDLMLLVKMKQGPKDESGRSSFVALKDQTEELKTDLVLMAVGQKTDTDFIKKEINKNSLEKIKLNDWGNIEANLETLQTGVKNIFAIGDSVTGPATIIEAIAQAKKAAFFIDQFLKNKKLEIPKKEFLSKKENFKEQDKVDYESRFFNKTRQEMPVLAKKDRSSFQEVELGYNQKQLEEEAKRCLECGCNEYYTCDLKKYSTEYQANQEKYKGEFKEYEIDFRHPLIEIDNNKCILCGRCVRICSEVVGDKALGFVKRGFETYIAPSMEKPLHKTSCESCGLCIETCPTGAISENFAFKPGPFELEKIESIDNLTSEGYEIDLFHKGGFFMQASPRKGKINQNLLISRDQKFGYTYLNDSSRILKPKLKIKKSKSKSLSLSELIDYFNQKLPTFKPKETAVFVGSRLTNEEQFKIKQFSSKILKTKNIFSLHYLNRGAGYRNLADLSVHFKEIEKSDQVFIIESELNEENQFVNHEVFKAKFKKNLKVNLITTKNKHSLDHKIDEKIKVRSVYDFLKQTNKNFFLKAKKPLIIFNEKDLSSNEVIEIKNLILSSKNKIKLLALREKNNSSGLINQGIALRDEKEETKFYKNLINQKIKNIFIFGEDPIGCAKDAKIKTEFKKILKKLEFSLVSDYFLTETAQEADLVIPENFPIEKKSSFTNTQNVIQKFSRQIKSSVKVDLNQFLEEIFKSRRIKLKNLDLNQLKKSSKIKSQKTITKTSKNNPNRLFDYGCDGLLKKVRGRFRGV
jgi:formate dehydrogenase major subunit